MPKVQTVTLELQRPGPPHNQLLSPLTPYLAMCAARAANTVYLDFEQRDVLLQARGLSYEMTPEYQVAQLNQAGTTMGKLLGGIRSLATAIAEAAEPSAAETALIHLRLVSDAAELSILPFESAIAGAGFPGEGQPLLLQSDAPICLTRESRKPLCRELDYFNADQKILFAYAEFPGNVVPIRAHLLALRRAFDPWCDAVDLAGRTRWARSRITVLPHASLDAIREACSRERYCYVHVLAHGVPRWHGLTGEQQFGLALHDAHDPQRVDVVDGARLAEVLCGYDRQGQSWWCPKVVTLAACDSGHQGTIIVPGGSVAHALHMAGVPLVVASQFPLTFAGSALMAEVLYSGLLWGEDPFVLLHEMRRRLHIEQRTSLDWASLVAYSAWPASLERESLTFQYNRAVRALEAFDKRLRARLGRQGKNFDYPEALQRRDLSRVDTFRARMEAIVPALTSQLGSFLSGLDDEAAQVADHNIDCASTRLLAQANVRKADLECQLAPESPQWRQTLKETYRLLAELQRRSDGRGRELGCKELLLLIKLSLVLTGQIPERPWQQAEEALQRLVAKSRAGGPLLASPPLLWLHAAQAELYVLAANNPDHASKLQTATAAMRALVKMSDPDDLDQVRYGYQRLTTRWAASLPPEVVRAAESVVAALDGKAPSASSEAKPEPQSPDQRTSGSPNPRNEATPVMSDRSAPVPVTGHSNLLLFGPNATECSRFQGCGCLVDAKGNYFASGVVIGKHVVLTAKHCLKNRVTGQPVDRVLIGAKRADEGDATMLWKVLEKIQNPDTDLLILIVESEPLASPAAISLEKEAFELATPVEIERQREFTMVGFGADNPSNGGGFGVKREVVLRKNQLLEFSFSAGFSNYADTAQGDSGGPALIQVGNDYKLAGITSCAAKPPYGGIYVRVDQYWDWIKKILAQNT